MLFADKATIISSVKLTEVLFALINKNTLKIQTKLISTKANMQLFLILTIYRNKQILLVINTRSV